MKKTVSLILSLIMVVVLLGGCNSTPKEQSTPVEKNESSSQQEKKNPLDLLKDAFAKAGFSVGENEMLAYEMLGATAGYKFTLDGELIEIYYYDKSSLTDEGKNFLQQAKKGSIDMSGFNIPVKFKNNLMIIRYDEHSNKDKVLEVFNGFNY